MFDFGLLFFSTAVAVAIIVLVFRRSTRPDVVEQSSAPSLTSQESSGRTPIVQVKTSAQCGDACACSAQESSGPAPIVETSALCGDACACTAQESSGRAPIVETSAQCGDACACSAPESSDRAPIVKVLYGTQTGTAKLWANRLSASANDQGYRAEVLDLSTYDTDELQFEDTLLFVVSTYTDGKPPESVEPFFNELSDLALDIRIDRGLLANVRFAVFGIGHSIYDANFNACGIEIDRLMSSLGARRLVPVGKGDNGAGVEISETFNLWEDQLFKSLGATAAASDVRGNVSRPAQKVSDEFDDDSGDDESEPMVDVEDLGKFMKKPKKPARKEKKEPKSVPATDAAAGSDSDSDSDDDDEAAAVASGAPPKQMLTPSLAASLTKQGYRLIGSHSGVKMCRWTKAMLRGRGGCYKHTFYGISSFQCMEMTPSLACANKCVFCWRHHKNPVGKEWRWEVDSPEMLVEGAVANHLKMVKQMKGVPGVVPERFAEASTIKHCALSLVGEPIIYPYINRFIDLLHERNISSFMVTNAQFPDKIAELKPVTQLYISVDAATKESLKKIDRPLFSDFWERFMACIDEMREKGTQRTVFRLTLVKSWNTEELENYAQLIRRGMPSFVEIKGMTFCGNSKASSLRMENVPFHEEVVAFARQLLTLSGLDNDYELAAVHEHSCCILIAQKRFKVNGEWNTWIDYGRFHELVQAGKPFSAVDYMAPTPHWALFDSEEKGFDPEEVRFRRTKPYSKGGC
eukprot:TRINITY_DN72_c0_g1_i1.p1 TRINITY_DN72_c0_g1~~TRINITY_DN72_c0_g1_i1.p1  ORF type:complete len:748 (+),score=116.68 TRINITY_DN72_c0_g1_i1:114-2357(+)